MRSAADAEDIVQEAFVRFWRKQHSIENRALLFAAVRSIALDLLRRDSRRARREATASLDMEHTTEPQFDFDDGVQRELAIALDLLPVEQREVLVMKIWNELTFAEIGAALEISNSIRRGIRWFTRPILGKLHGYSLWNRRQRSGRSLRDRNTRLRLESQ